MRKTRRIVCQTLFLLFLILLMSVSAQAAVKSSALIAKNQTITLSIPKTSQKVTWTTSVKSVAKITKISGSTCKVLGVGSGHSIVTGKYGKYVYQWDIGVQNPTLSAKKVQLKKGQTVKLVLKGTNQKVTWKTSDKSVATVASAGKVSAKVTAKKNGTAFIYATVLKMTYTCTVNVGPVPSGNKKLLVTPTSLVVKQGATGKVNITYTGSGGIEYLNYNPDIAYVALGSWSGRTIPLKIQGLTKGQHAKIVISGGGESVTVWVRVD